VCFPPRAVAEQFGSTVTPLFARAKANDEEGKTLAAIRDTLLPKLISGEIRFKDAEKTVETVL
jgi:type I restriction enzyme, S subunit